MIMQFILGLAAMAVSLAVIVAIGGGLALGIVWVIEAWHRLCR